MEKKWILITGATRGIGREIVRKFSLNEEYRFVFLTRNGINLKEYVSDQDYDSFYFECDLSDLDSLEIAFERLKGRKIKFSCFIHCAGLSPLMPISELNMQLMLETYSVNYFSFMLIMKYLANPEFSHDECKIIAMSSVTTTRKGRRQSIYASSKAALENSIHYLANELLNRRFSIIGLSLAVVDTDMFKSLGASSSELMKRSLERQPLGILHPEEIGEVVYDMLDCRLMNLTTGTIIELNCGYLF